jgi:hypothetical protein
LLASLAAACEAGVLKEVLDELNAFCGTYNDWVTPGTDETTLIADALKDSGWLTADGKVK